MLQTHFTRMQEGMADFAEIWAEELNSTDFHVKKTLTSAFRRIIGMGVATGGVWSGNIRSFRHMVALRTDPSVEEEIVEVYLKIGRDLISEVPELFGDFDDRFSSLVPMYHKV